MYFVVLLSPNIYFCYLYLWRESTPDFPFTLNFPWPAYTYLYGTPQYFCDTNADIGGSRQGCGERKLWCIRGTLTVNIKGTRRPPSAVSFQKQLWRLRNAVLGLHRYNFSCAIKIIGLQLICPRYCCSEYPPQCNETAN